MALHRESVLGLRVSLLGDFELRDAQGNEIVVAGTKARALLAYLMAHPNIAFTRRHLASLFWGEGTNGSSRVNLRQTLARLRRQLPEDGAALIQAEADRLLLLIDPGQIDQHRHQTALDGGPGEAALDDALAALGRDFLADLVDISPGFERWRQAEGRRLRDLARTAAETALRDRLTRGAREPALSAARHLVWLDPGNEIGHRAVMAIEHAKGNRATALRQYQRCAEALAAHGAEPEMLTRDLHREIRAGLSARALPPVAPAEIDANQTVSVLMGLAGGSDVTGDVALDQIRAQGGRLIGRMNGAVLSIFTDLASATNCARSLRERIGGRARIAVNVGPVALASLPATGPGVDQALALVREIEAGDIIVRPAQGVRPRLLEPDTDLAPAGPLHLAALLQWGGLFGYLGIWVGLIIWRIVYYAEHKTWPCWPDFLCG